MALKVQRKGTFFSKKVQRHAQIGLIWEPLLLFWSHHGLFWIFCLLKVSFMCRTLCLNNIISPAASVKSAWSQHLYQSGITWTWFGVFFFFKAVKAAWCNVRKFSFSVERLDRPALYHVWDELESPVESLFSFKTLSCCWSFYCSFWMMCSSVTWNMG